MAGRLCKICFYGVVSIILNDIDLSLDNVFLGTAFNKGSVELMIGGTDSNGGFRV